MGPDFAFDDVNVGTKRVGGGEYWAYWNTERDINEKNYRSKKGVNTLQTNSWECFFYLFVSFSFAPGKH